MTADRSITAVVPMRHSSERVRGKNYRVLGQRPLFHHVVRSLLATPGVAEVIVDTDSDLILEDCASNLPDVRTVVRPEHLRDGHTAMNDVLRHTVEYARTDVVMQTHSTNPFVRPDTFQSAIDAYFEDDGHDSVFGVSRIQGRLWSEDLEPINHDPRVLLRTQDLAPVYLENSCFYVFHRATLESTGNRLGARPRGVEVPALEAIDIDEESDWALAVAVEAAGIAAW